MKTLAPALAVLALCLASSSALAAPTAADKAAAKAFVEGQKAYDAGDYRRAAAAFETAYAAKPHHAALWNAAKAWTKAGEDLKAANILERYLAEAPPDAPDRDRATAALADVGKRVGRVQIQTSNVTNPKLDGENLPAGQIYVAPGEHVASGESEGDQKPVRKVFTVGAGEMTSVMLEPPPPEAPPPPPPPPQIIEVQRGGGLPAWVVIVGGSLVLVGGGLTAVSGFDTVSKKDAFLGDQTQSNLDTAFSAQTRTNVVLAITGGVALLTGVAALLVDWKGSARTSALADFVGFP